MLEFPTMECDTPTQSFVVGAVNGTTQFNVTKLEFPKNACIRLSFFNPDDQEHDLTVLDKAGEEWIHMDAIYSDEDEGLNSTDHTYYFGSANKTTAAEQGKGLATHFWLTPNEDITLEAFCEVLGHKDAGMHFPVIIGKETASSPGFELPLVLASSLLVGVIVVSYRKRMN